MTAFDKISKAELVWLIEGFFRTDHDLTSCVVCEKPIGVEFYTEITKLRVRVMRENMRRRERPAVMPDYEDTKLAVQALVVGYVLGKESQVKG